MVRFELIIALLAAQGPAELQVREPVAAVAVDAQAYEKAKELFACMRDFKARHREERAKPENLARLGEQELQECAVANRRKEIAERLKTVHPEMTETQLQQEFQKTAITAALEAFRASK